MSRSDRTHLHQIFPLEEFGDTLVVTPAGDAAGFHLPHVHAEMSAAIDFFDKAQLKHLVFDLSRARYFGSQVLGQLIVFSQKVKAKGGRVALANPSTEMLDVLRIMKVDTVWEVFPSRSKALTAIARRPLSTHLVQFGRRSFPVVLLGCLGAAWWYWPRRNLDHHYHDQLLGIYRESRQLLDTNPRDQDWDQHLTKSRQQLEKITAELETIASSQREALRRMIYCSRDYLFPALQDKLKLDSYPHFMFFQEMKAGEHEMREPVKTLSETLRPEGLTNPRALPANPW